MADELELKAVVADPGALRARLLAAGAVRGFVGLMEDRRFDQRGELAAREEVLRVRSFRYEDGRVTAELAWKGPTRRSREGYKRREEVACRTVDAAAAAPLFEALGFRVVHAIDRWVEVYELGGAVLRLEWYPRMDVLLEVEGDARTIEAAIAITGLPRDAFSAESLVEFVQRYEPRAGRPAALALAELGGEPPAWLVQ
jgi:adenylate cyclase class IV